MIFFYERYIQHPSSSPVVTSQTLPRSFHSPKHTPPMDHLQPTSPSKHNHSKPSPRSSPYKEGSRSSPAHRQGSSHTTGRDHKKKEGRSIVKQWVQEQQMRYVGGFEK